MLKVVITHVEHSIMQNILKPIGSTKIQIFLTAVIFFIEAAFAGIGVGRCCKLCHIKTILLCHSKHFLHLLIQSRACLHPMAIDLQQQDEMFIYHQYVIILRIMKYTCTLVLFL